MLAALYMTAMNTPIAQSAERVAHLTPGLPVFIDEDASVETNLHRLTVTITKTEAKVESVTLFRNPDATPASGSVYLPFLAYRRNENDIKGLKVLWMDKEQPAVPARSPRSNMPDVPGLVRDIPVTYVYPVTLPAKGSGSFKATFTIPLTAIGIDDRAKEFTYEVAPRTDTIAQFQFAIKYTEDDVFRVIVADASDGKFQVGPRGAFLKLDNHRFDERARFRFDFYPNVLDPDGR